LSIAAFFGLHHVLPTAAKNKFGFLSVGVYKYKQYFEGIRLSIQVG
jgi:hypothetical protein